MLFLSYLVINFNKFHNMPFVNLQIMSMKNKANKAKQRTNHTSGQKSFQAVSFDAVRFQFNFACAYVVLSNCIRFFD